MIVIYYIHKHFLQNNLEGFQLDNDTLNMLRNRDASSTSVNQGEDLTQKDSEFQETIIEKSLNSIYPGATKLICNMKPTTDTSLCMVEGKPMVKYLFPVHMLKMPDTSILAVFNDGRIYMKNDILDNMWKGPIKNSIPFDSVPLRMITISYRDNSLLGIGHDNNLYAKQANAIGGLDIYGEWVLVPNNQNIIFCMVDKDTKKLICIDVNGSIYTKETVDITSSLVPTTDISVPVLKLFYDENGYMLALDTKFNLVQFKTRDWKSSSLNYDKGVNKTRVFDVMYDNDAKFYGLVFVPGAGILEIMKQQQIYFMSDFIPLEFHTESSLHTTNFAMNDMNVILYKTGVNMVEDNNDYGSEHNRDEDLNYAYMKSMMDDKRRLREFCKNRGIGSAAKYENYEMVNQIQEQGKKIKDLNKVIANLMEYEPEKHKIQEKVLLDY